MRCRDRGVGVAHLCIGNYPTLNYDFGLSAKKRRLPQDQIRQLADLHRTDLRGHSVRDRRIDGVFGDIAAGAEVVGPIGILGQQAALLAHLVRRLPGPADHFAHPPHRLAVGGDNRQRAQVVQNILGGDRLLANPALSEGHILGDILVEMVADHQHVEMLIDGIDRKRPSRIRRGGQHISLTAQFHNIGCVATASAFGMVGMDRTALKRRARSLDKTRLVERIGMDTDLHVIVFSNAQTRIDRRRGRAPILVQLKATSTAFYLLYKPRT